MLNLVIISGQGGGEKCDLDHVMNWGIVTNFAAQ
jgi:hypothetical protein